MQTFKIEQTDSQCVVTWWHFSLSVFFMFVWLAGWTVACGFLIHLVLVERSVFTFLFASPFWAAWFFVAFIVIPNMLFGKTRFVLDENEFEEVWTCLFFKRTKQIKLADIQRFETKGQKNSDGDLTFSLRVVLQEGDADFNVQAKKEELSDVCQQLNDFLKKFKEVEIVRAPVQWEMPMVFEYNSPPQYLEPPPKCRWHYQADFNEFGFRLHGSGKISEVFSSLFFAAFWNGILTPFLLVLTGVLKAEPPLEGGMWWLLFFFLIPFTVVGLILLWGTIDAFLNLFRRTSWHFAYGEAVFRTVRLRTRVVRYDLTCWNALAIRLVRAKQSEEPDNEDDLENFYEEGNHWQLVFLDKSEADLAVIEKLRKPEALWLADVILRERRTIR